VNSKPAWKSRTFWAIVATAAVLATREVAPPEWRAFLNNAQAVLGLAGLWFSRLGAGTPIGHE
jgi:hypothetical protein